MVDIVRYMKRSVTQHFQRLFNMWVEYLSRIHRRVTTENPSRLICRWWYPTRILFPIELRGILTIIYIIQFTFFFICLPIFIDFPAGPTSFANPEICRAFYRRSNRPSNIFFSHVTSKDILKLKYILVYLRSSKIYFAMKLNAVNEWRFNASIQKLVFSFT